MSFTVLIHDQEPFAFDGIIVLDGKQAVFTDGKNSVQRFKQSQVIAIMREEFADRCDAAFVELNHLKHGNPEAN